MKVKLPIGSILLMLIFLVGGTLIITLGIPGSFWNLGIGQWIIGYLGYIFLVGAAIYHVIKE